MEILPSAFWQRHFSAAVQHCGQPDRGQFAGDFIGNAFLWFHKCVSPCSADYFLTIIAKSGPGSKPKNIQIFSADRKKNDSPPKRSSSAGGGQGKEGSFRFSLR